MFKLTISMVYAGNDGSTRTFTADTVQAVMHRFVHFACKALPDYLPSDCTFNDVVAWYAQHGYAVTIGYE